MTLQLTGTRVDTGGPTYKRLETATDDNYTLTDFVAKNYLGLVSVERRASTVKNVTITNGRVYNIDRVFVLPYDDAELDGALFQDLDCYDLERGFMRLKRARNVTLRRIIARQRASGTTQFADAFATSDLPTLNIKFEDVQCIGFDMIVPAGAYPNGGAFSDEELSVNTSYLRCLAKDGNDGWDLKGGDTAVACRSQNNHRNWRLWGSTTITDCWSVGASNAFFWFGGGSRLGACKLVRPRIVDSGSTAPWFKVDTHTSAASITIVDPLDGNGNLIPEATILSRFQWDAPKLMTVTVQYTGATSFPAVDTTPRPPIITAGGPVTPDPPADVTIAPPTDVKLTYDTGTGRATLTWTPPSGATAVEVFERTNTPVVALGSYPAGTNLRVSTVLKVPGEYTFSVVAVFADGRRSIEVPADPASLVLPLTTPPVDGGGGPPPVDPPPDNPPGETPDPPADIHGLVTITRNGVRKVYRVLGQSQTPSGPGDTGGGGVPAPPGTAPTWAQTKALAKSSGKPIIIAHRGGGGEIAKNNALSAIDQDLALGMGTDDHMIPDGGDHWVGADGGLYNSHDSTTGAYMNQDMTVSSATAASWAALRMKDFPTYRGTISNEAPPTSRQTLERIKAIGKFTVPEDKDHSSSSRAKLRDLILDLGMQNSVQVQSFQAADLGPAKTAGMSVGLLQNSSANIGATAILTCVNGGPPDLVLYDPRSAPGNSDTWVKAMIDAGIALQVGTFSRRYDLDKEKIRVANLGGNITFVPADNPFYIARKNTPLAADRWDTQYWEHGQIPSDTSTEPQIQSTGKLKFANATASQWTLLGGFADETQGCWTICEFDVTFDALDTTTSRWIGLEWALADDRNFHDGTDNGVGSLAMRFRQTGQIQLYNRTSNTLSTMVADNVTAVGTTSSTTLTPITAGQTIRVRVENLTDSSGAFTGQARVTRMDTGQWVMTAVGDAPVRGPYMHLGKNGTTGSVISVANLAVTYSATAAPPPVVTPPVEVTQVTPLDDAMVVYETDAGSGPQSVFTVPRPTDGGPLAAGDLLLFSFSIDVPATAPTLAAFTSVPAGATALVPGTLITGSSTSLLGAAVYTKIVTSAEAATPPASWSFTLGASYDGSASVVRFRGVDATSPFTVSTGNVAVATSTSTTSNTKTSPSVTTTSGNALLVAGVMHRSGTSILTGGDPVGYTLDVNAFGVGGRGHGVAHATQATAGASPTAVWRQSSGGVGLAWQTALRRAGATPTTPSTPAAAVPKIAQRIVSEVTATTALVGVKVSNATSVRLKCGTNDALTTGVVFGTPVTPDAQGMAFLPVGGLTGGKTNYRFRIAMTDANGVEVLDTLAVGKFRTDGAGPVSFTFGSCTNTTDPDTFDAIAGWDDDLFFHIGDLYYADGSGTSTANIQSKMDAKLAAPHHSLVWSTRECPYVPSDHDLMNNDATGLGDPTAAGNWNTSYRTRFLPSSKLPGSGVYRTFTKGNGLVRFILLDTRTFKSAISAADTASKTCLGTTQKAWLKSTITAATESVIVLVNADPWIGAAATGDDSWVSYATERLELANFFKNSGKSIVMTGGDMHALAADNGTNALGGITVFHAAPFYNSASIKGGPYSAGTYPTASGATVKQYGRVVITPNTSTVAVSFTGYSAPTTSRITLTKTFPLTAPIGPDPDPTPTVTQPYTADSYYKSRVDGSGVTVSASRTASFQSFMATAIDQKAFNFPKLNLNDNWAMSYAYGTSSDPIWKLTGVQNEPQLSILTTQGFHMPDSMADTFPTGTQDRPGLVIDKAFGYTVLFADSVPNKTTRTIAVSSGGIFWHSSNGLDVRNPLSNDTRNWTSRGRIPDAMVITREELDAAVAAGTGVGKVLHIFFTETNSADGFRHPMIGAENGQFGWGAEGERMRIKPSVDLVARGITGHALAIARTLQQNGGYLGDNAGGPTQVKLSQTFHYVGTNLATDVFQGKLTWADFEILA